MEKVLNGIFIVLVAVALVIEGFWLYFFVFNGDKGFATNITTIAEDMTAIVTEDETKTYPIEVNYYSNEEKNGFKLLEIKINSYTSAEMTSFHSFGLQLVNPVWTLERYRIPGSNIFKQRYAYAYRPNVNTYNTSDDVSYQASNPISRTDQIIFDIDGEPFALKVKSSFKNEDGIDAICDTLVLEDDLGVAKYYYDYDWAMLTKQLQDIAETVNYGDYEIGLVDLSDFVVLEKYNSETKQFEKLDNFDNYKNFFKIKIHSDKNGVTSCEQSLFKMIDYNPYYFSNSSTDNDYWKAVAEYYLTIEDFNKRIAAQGVFLTIKSEVAERLNNYADVLEVVINLELDTESIAGIDAYGLYGFKAKEINLTSTTSRTFYLLSNSVTNSGLEKININQNIKVQISDTAGFTGVIENE